jgi:hypothetical protein
MGFTLRWPRHKEHPNGSGRNGHVRDRSAVPIGRVTPIDEAIPLIDRELRRARRYEHPLGILVLTLADGLTPDARRWRVSAASKSKDRSDPSSSTVPGTSGNGIAALGAMLSRTIRETDVLTSPEGERYYLLALPETGYEAMALAAQRIHRGFVETGHPRLRIGMAEFPSQGLTLDELFDRARKEWLMNPLPLDGSSNQEEAAHA